MGGLRIQNALSLDLRDSSERVKEIVRKFSEYFDFSLDFSILDTLYM